MKNCVVIFKNIKGEYTFTYDHVEDGTPEADLVRLECKFYGRSTVNGEVDFYEKADDSKIYGSVS